MACLVRHLGVRFVGVDDAPADLLAAPIDCASLPGTWFVQLQDAAVTADVAKLQSLVKNIRGSLQSGRTHILFHITERNCLTVNRRQTREADMKVVRHCAKITYPSVYAS
jgi:hypothetical protein